MNTVFIDELKREKQAIEGLLIQCRAEIKAAAATFERTGDGGEIWRKKFDERFELAQKLEALDRQIDQALREMPHVGQAVLVYEGSRCVGQTTIATALPRIPRGMLIVCNPIVGASAKLVFDETGRCTLPGCADFTYKVAVQFDVAQAA